MPGFDVVVRVVRLALESSGEGVETLERSAAQAASAYGVDVELVLLPEQVILTDRVSGDVAHVATVRATPGILRLDRVAALKRVLNRMALAWMRPRPAACSTRSKRCRPGGRRGHA